MAEWLDDLFVSDTEPQFVDADTVRTPEGDIRIQGVNAYEQDKIKDGMWVPGQVGGIEATQLTDTLAKKHGFTQPVSTGEKDVFGRYLGDMVNPETGELLSNKMLESGLANTSLYSSKEQLYAEMQGRLDRLRRQEAGTLTDWDIAGESLRNYRNKVLPLEAKQMALDEKQFMTAPGMYSPMGVQIGRHDWEFNLLGKQTTSGKYKAKSSWKTAWALGVSGIQEGLWGSFDMISDMTGMDTTGQDRVERIQREIADMPILENQMAFDEDGNWRLDSATQVLDFLVTNGAMSAPYMVQSILAAAAAPMTFGGSLAVPSLTYIGQTYNEQKEKDPASAITSGLAQGALEYLGFRGVAGKAFLNNPEYKKKVLKEVADSKFNGDLGMAEAAVANSTMRELRNMSKNVKDHLQQQFKNKYIETAKAGGAGMLKGSAAESLTEAGQEAFAILGANNFDISSIDVNEAKNRMLNAAVAGGLIGGAMKGVTDTTTTYRTAALGDLESDADLTRASNDYKDQQELIAAGKDTTIDSLLTEHSDSDTSIQSFSNAEYDRRRKQGNKFSALKDQWQKGIGGLYKGFSRELNDRFRDRGMYVRDVLSVIGGNKTRSGSSLEEFQHLTASELQNIVGSEADAVAMFNVPSIHDVTNVLLDNDVTAILDRVTEAYSDGKGSFKSFRAAYNSLVSQGKMDPLPAKYADKMEAILEYGQRLDALDYRLSRISGKAKTAGRNLKTFNKTAIANKTDKFIEMLKTKGFTLKQAEELTNNILDREYTNSIDNVTDPFLNLDMGSLAKMDPKVLQKLNKDPDMQAYFNNDLFYNMALINNSTAATLANRRYLGKDGKVIASMIKKSLDAGEITQDEAEYLAAEVNDYMKMRTGEYNVIKSPGWKAFQQNALLLTTLNQLPLAAVSSLVEIGLVDRGTIHKARAKIMEDAVKTAGKELKYYVEGAAYQGKLLNRKSPLSEEHRALFELGYLQESMAAAQKHDVKLHDGWQQQVIDNFFKYTGLQGVTNYTRTLRLALAQDAVNGWIEDVANSNGVITKQTLEAQEALQNLGINIPFMVDMYNKGKRGYKMDETEQAKHGENMRLASFNFVNDAVAHPTKSNRPKFYNNPRTALFFQFQGFLSTFTANILPKLYKQAFGANTPMSSKLDAFGTILTLIAISFLSQYLKDLIKFGEETPYLDDVGLTKRALYSSGLLGTGERLITKIPGMELYDSRGGNNILETVYKNIEGEAPVLGYGGRIADAVGEIFTGGDRAVYKTLKASPFTGPLTGWNKEVSDAVNDLF